jgi:hypothetical protein
MIRAKYYYVYLVKAIVHVLCTVHTIGQLGARGRREGGRGGGGGGRGSIFMGKFYILLNRVGIPSVKSEHFLVYSR